MTSLRSRIRPGPGGVDDGLPSDPTGAPLLHRWFAIAVAVLVPVGLVVVIWAFLSISRPQIEPAARRPPGDATVTHERGGATLNHVRTAEPGPDCAAGITLVGDESARATSRRALSAVCQLLQRPDLGVARTGLERWAASSGMLRIAVFELTGVESSARVEDGATVVEINAKFQFEPGARAAPAIIHELVHLGQGFPGRPVTARDELAAVQAQRLACERLALGDNPPRGCQDVRELLSELDPLDSIRRAGYPRE
ncbi:MAG: hypothetical protein M3N57_07275 [Actinomycetota bacterium]|nr:hypothetical protein [Actinomycetota bacterium]